MTKKGMTTLKQYGLLGVSGPEAKSFLQGQVTAHMDTITLSQSKLGGHCNLKGRLQSLFQIMLIETETGPLYLLIMPRSMMTQAIQQFKKYALFSKASFSDLSETMPLIGLVHDNTPWSSLAIDDCLTETLPEGQYTVRRVQGQTPRFSMVCHSQAVYQALLPSLQKKYGEITPEQWKYYDIEAGLPTIYPQTVDKVLPHHINLIELNGVSFDKGCYLGQEIVARMHYKGKIKKHLYKALIESNNTPQPGDEIFSQHASSADAPGIIIDIAPAETGYHVLVVLDDEQVESHTLRWGNTPLTLKLK